MLIVCPSCASEYTLDPGRVGVEGRIVRCASCRNTWFVEPADGARIETFGPMIPEPPPAIPNLSVEATNARTGPAAPVGSAVNGAARRPGAARQRSPTEPRPSGRFPVGFALAALTISIATGAVAGRAGIVQAFPAMAQLYAAAGLTVNLRGLALRDVRSELSTVEGTTVLVVEGEIENVAAAAVDVPPIEIAVQGDDGGALYTWTNDPPRGTLERAETARFRARLASPPAEGRRILVRFAPANAVAVADPGLRP